MTSTFSITTASNQIQLAGTQRRAGATYTVTNASGQAIRGRASLATVPPAAPHLAWLALEGESERPFPIAATEQFRVGVDVPAGAAPGNYTFRLNMLATHNPDETFTEGPTITIAVPEPTPQTKKFPLWVIPVALIAVAIVAVVLVFALRPRAVVVPDVVGLTIDDALDELEGLGLRPRQGEREFNSAVPAERVSRTDPEAGEEVEPEARIWYFVSNGPEPAPTAIPTPSPTATAPPTAAPTATATPMLPLLGSYPLTSNGRDASGLGNHLDLNAISFASGAAYCDGSYDATNPAGCRLRTPLLDGFKWESFTVTGEFNADEYADRPVIVGGNSNRWLALYLSGGGGTRLKYNNSNFAECAGTYFPGVWTRFRLSYDGAAARLTIDGTLVCTVNFTIDQSGSDANFGLTDYSNAGVFKGQIRDLRIYNTSAVP